MCCAESTLALNPEIQHGVAEQASLTGLMPFFSHRRDLIRRAWPDASVAENLGERGCRPIWRKPKIWGAAEQLETETGVGPSLLFLNSRSDDDGIR